MLVKSLVLGLCLLAGVASMARAQYSAQLRADINRIVQGKQAVVGVAIQRVGTADTLSVNGDRYFPMQSVFKLHLALAVLHRVDQGRLALHQPVTILPSDLLPDTWSPLRDRYPQGNVQVPLSEIIRYTVALSDNNGCDILLRMIGGPDSLQAYINSIGIEATEVRYNEQDMQAEWDRQYANRTTPRAVVQLLQQFYQGQLLQAGTQQYLWEVLVQTTTGAQRIKAGVPAGAVVAHKTGSSGANAQGEIGAINDVGIVLLPSGQVLLVAVLVANSHEGAQASEGIIAAIVRRLCAEVYPQ